MGREKSLAPIIRRSLGFVKIIGFIGLIAVAARVNSEDAFGEPAYGILCISECPTCPTICSPPPPPPSSKSYPTLPPSPLLPLPLPSPPLSHSPPPYVYTNPPLPPPRSLPPPPKSSPTLPTPQAPEMYPVWGPPPLPPPQPPNIYPVWGAPPSPPYKSDKPPPPSKPYSPIISSHTNVSSPFYYYYSENAAFKSSLPAYSCTLLLLHVLLPFRPF